MVAEQRCPPSQPASLRQDGRSLTAVPVSRTPQGHILAKHSCFCQVTIELSQMSLDLKEHHKWSGLESGTGWANGGVPPNDGEGMFSVWWDKEIEPWALLAAAGTQWTVTLMGLHSREGLLAHPEAALRAHQTKLLSLYPPPTLFAFIGSWRLWVYSKTSSTDNGGGVTI